MQQCETEEEGGGGGELKRKCLSQRIQSALQEKQNQFSTSCEAATQRAVAVAATACGHFDIFFVGFLLYFIAFCCMLQLENSSCITLAVHEKSQWPTEIAGHVFWYCGSGFDGSVRGSGRGGGVMRVRATPSYCSSAVHFIIILRAIKMKCQTKWQQFWLNFFVYDSVDKK